MSETKDPALVASELFDAARRSLDFVMERKAGPHFVVKAARHFYDKGKAFEATIPESDAGRVAKLKDAERGLAHTLDVAEQPLPVALEGAASALAHVRAVITSLQPPASATTENRAPETPPSFRAEVLPFRPTDT